MGDQRSPRGVVTSLYIEDFGQGTVLDRGKTVMPMKVRGLFARSGVGGSPEAGR